MNFLKPKTMTMTEKYAGEVNKSYEVLQAEEASQDENEVNVKWKHLRQSLAESVSEVIPKRVKRKSKDWITDEILGLMDE